MFTIKHITDKREDIYSAERVTFYSNSEDVAMSFKSIGLKEAVTLFDGNDKAICDLCRGTVYVMNNHGSTVAKYDMFDVG